jgi:hypothetical protein
MLDIGLYNYVGIPLVIECNTVAGHCVNFKDIIVLARTAGYSIIN